MIDAAKFQNFVFTLVLAAAYVALSIQTIAVTDAGSVKSLPDLPASFLALLGISHAAYAAGKLPPADGDAPGLTVANRDLVISGVMPMDDPRNKPSGGGGQPSPPPKPPGVPAGAGAGEGTNAEGGE